mgnify:CR=1 FL=1
MLAYPKRALQSASTSAMNFKPNTITAIQDPMQEELFSKIIHRIIIADIPHNSTDKLHFIRIFALLNQVPKHIAEDSAEIFMPRIGEKTAAVREHPNKFAD